METIKRCIRYVLFILRAWARARSVRRFVRVITIPDSIFEYISHIPAHSTFEYATASFVRDNSVVRVSDMAVGQHTVEMLKRAQTILVAASEDVSAPIPQLLPRFVKISRVQVYGGDVRYERGTIVARLHGMQNQLVATIRVGAENSTVFHLGGREDAQPVTEHHHRVVVFIRI